MRLLIDEASKVRGAVYLSVNKRGKSYWAQAPNACMNIDRLEVVAMIDYLVDNIFIQVGNNVFRQCVGIPMGTDCAPLLANLYLFYFEYRYMRGLLKNNFHLARRFSNTVRYIDDLLTLNNPSFENEITNIYPPELVLKRTTESTHMVSYLDISITIFESKYVTNVYDKRDDFNFKIVKFPFMDSNIPTKPAYGVYISQLVRIGRICERYETFVERHRMITSRQIHQGFHYTKLCDSFKKFSRGHKSIFSRYGVSIKRHILDGICQPLAIIRSLSRRVATRRPTCRE